MSVSAFSSQGSRPTKRRAAAPAICRWAMGAVHKGIVSVSGLRGPAQFVNVLPHTFACSIPSRHLIKGPLASGRKGGHSDLGRRGGSH